MIGEDLQKAIDYLQLSGAAKSSYIELVQGEAKYNNALAGLNQSVLDACRKAYQHTDYTSLSNAEKQKYVSMQEFETIAALFADLRTKQAALNQAIQSPTPNFADIQKNLTSLEDTYREYVVKAGGIKLPPNVNNALQTDPSVVNPLILSILIEPIQRGMRYNMLFEAFQKNYGRQDQKDPAVEASLANLMEASNQFADKYNQGRLESEKNEANAKLNQLFKDYQLSTKDADQTNSTLAAALKTDLTLVEPKVIVQELQQLEWSSKPVLEFMTERLQDIDKKAKEIREKKAVYEDMVNQNEAIIREAKQNGKEPSFYKEEVAQLATAKKDVAKTTQALDSLTTLRDGLAAIKIITDFKNLQSKTKNNDKKNVYQLIIDQCNKQLNSNGKVDIGKCVQDAMAEHIKNGGTKATFKSQLPLREQGIFESEFAKAYNNAAKIAPTDIATKNLFKVLPAAQATRDQRTASDPTPAPAQKQAATPNRPRSDELTAARKSSKQDTKPAIKAAEAGLRALDKEMKAYLKVQMKNDNYETREKKIRDFTKRFEELDRQLPPAHKEVSSYISLLNLGDLERLHKALTKREYKQEQAKKAHQENDGPSQSNPGFFDRLKARVSGETTAARTRSASDPVLTQPAQPIESKSLSASDPGPSATVAEQQQQQQRTWQHAQAPTAERKEGLTTTRQQAAATPEPTAKPTDKPRRPSGGIKRDAKYNTLSRAEAKQMLKQLQEEMKGGLPPPNPPSIVRQENKENQNPNASAQAKDQQHESPPPVTPLRKHTLERTERVHDFKQLKAKAEGPSAEEGQKWQPAKPGKR